MRHDVTGRSATSRTAGATGRALASATGGAMGGAAVGGAGAREPARSWALAPLLRLLLLSLLAWPPAIAPALAQDGEPSRWYFEVEAINPGLGPAPDDLDRETPRALLESFLALAASDDPDAVARAAHLLDLREVPEAERAARGPILAGQLEEVLDRKVWLTWADVPDRPDGLSVAGGSDDPMAGEPRRSISLGVLELGNRPVSIRVNRIKPAGGDPVWLFSRQTVENVPALFDLYGPTAFERALPDALKSEVVLGLAWWELVALPLVLVATFVVGLTVHRLMRAWSDRTQRPLVGDMVHATALPLAATAAAAFAFWVTANLFTFSAVIDAFMAPALTVLTVAAVLLITVHVFDLLLDYLLADDVSELEKPENADRRRFQTNLSAARRLVLVVIFLVAVGAVMMQLNLFGGAGAALLGSAGVLTLVLAFAARSALSNIMSSLQIALSKSAKIGDAVLFEGQWAYVEKINFTYVQLKSWDMRRIIVPVNYFTSQPFENWTKRDPSLTKVVELRLSHFTDVDALRERFFAWVETRDDIEKPDECRVLVIGQDASGMLVRFYSNSKDPSTAWDMHCALREAMLRAASELDPGGEPGSSVLPVEREVKLADFTEAAE